MSRESTTASGEIKLRAEYARVLLKLLSIIAVATLALSPHHTPDKASAQSSTPETQNLTPEIYNGRPATPEEAAFSVWLKLGNSWCSGVLLSDRVVSTAYHCVVGVNGLPKDVSMMSVYSAGDPSQANIPVKEMRRLGIGLVFQNDRVLLLLSRPFKLNEKIQPIKLGVPEMLNDPNLELFAIGHGGSETGNFTKWPIVGKQVRYYGWDSGCRTEPGIIITQNVDENNQAVIFYGDSGGGLYVLIPEGHPLYEPGYYFLATTSKFCSEIEYDENGMEPSPYNMIGFQTIFFNDGLEKVNKILEETAEWPKQVDLRLPWLNKPANPDLYFPAIKNDAKYTAKPQITLPILSTD